MSMHSLMNNLGDLAGLDIAARRASGFGLAAEPLPEAMRRSRSPIDTILRHAAALFGWRQRDPGPFGPMVPEAAMVPPGEGEKRIVEASPQGNAGWSEPSGQAD